MTERIALRCETCDHGAEVHMWRGLGHMRGGCATCDCAALTGEVFPGMWPPAEQETTMTPTTNSNADIAILNAAYAARAAAEADDAALAAAYIAAAATYAALDAARSAAARDAAYIAAAAYISAAAAAAARADNASAAYDAALDAASHAEVKE